MKNEKFCFRNKIPLQVKIMSYQILFWTIHRELLRDSVEQEMIRAFAKNSM